jgi:hypothetical protein
MNSESNSKSHLKMTKNYHKSLVVYRINFAEFVVSTLVLKNQGL